MGEAAPQAQHGRKSQRSEELYEFAPPEEGEEAEKNASQVAQFVLDELVGT